MTRDRQTGDRRSDVLRLVRTSSSPLGVVDIADALGLHPNTARFHLQNLEADGLVERDQGVDGPADGPSTTPARRARGRPALRYRAVLGMDGAGPRSFDLLARLLLETLDDSEDSRRRAVEAGRRFGEGQASGRTVRAPGAPADPGSAPMSLLADLLDDLGFAPRLRPDDGGFRIDLRHCPFLELARERPQAVCPIHLGMMQGALDAWGASARVDRLDAFAEPDRCVARVTA